MDYTIYIIRHGQTDMNKKRVLQGRSDYPLNGDGVAQAEEAREVFRAAGISFDRIWSSPLQRAVQTAVIAAGGSLPQEGDGDAALQVPIETDERLLEMDYGPYEGTSLLDPSPEIMEFFSDFTRNPAPEGMEPLDEVVQRLGSFLEDLRARACSKETAGEAAASAAEDSATEDSAAEASAEPLSILISTHAIAMKGALEYLSPDSGGSYWAKHIANCEVYVSRLKDGRFSVPEPMAAEQK